MTAQRAGYAFAAVALVFSVLVLPSPARGAEPTLGASIGATGTVLVIDSTASVRQAVTLTAPEGWALADESLVMDPGERVRVPITASGPDGQIVATFEAIDLPAGVDTSRLVLSLGVAPPAPDLRALWLLLLIPMLLAALVVAWRYRHHA